jgi:hypothetical protein
MKRQCIGSIVIVAASIIGVGIALAAQDRYTLKVPGGLAFSEFKGYESWQVVSMSQDGGLLAVIVANPAMIDAYKAGIPGNGKPFPDGAKMAKIHYDPKKLETFPAATVPGTLHDVDFMVKGQQEVRGQRRMGICGLRIYRRVRHVRARHIGQQTAAGKRRQMRIRVPYDCEGKRLRLHRLHKALSVEI